MKVPTGLRKSDAELYIKTSARLNAIVIKDTKPGAPTLIEHQYHRLAERANKQFIELVTKGVKRHVDPNIDIVEKHIRKLKRLNPYYIPNERVRKLLDKSKKEKAKLIKHGEKRKSGRPKKDKFLDDLTKGQIRESAKFKEHSLAQKQMDFLRATYDNRDLGVAVGSGVDEDAEYEKLIELLKSGLPISREAFMGIMKSRKAQDVIIKAMGIEFFNKHFGAKEVKVKYSSDRWVQFKYEGGYKANYYKRGKPSDRMKALKNTKQTYYKKVKEQMKKP